MSKHVPYDDFCDTNDVWCERAPITKENKTFYVALLGESRPPVVELGVGDFNRSPFDQTSGEQGLDRKETLRRKHKMIRLAAVMSLVLSMSAAGHPEHLKEKEAVIWYLGHSGWAIETQSRFLIFDYWEESEPTETRALANGHIDPQEIKDKKVVVFVSHGHRDHFDPRILEWKNTIPDIQYIFGWKAEQGPDVIECDFEREDLDLGGLKIRTIVHDGDGIPESAFLFELDGLTIFHSGDHGNGPAPFKDFFVDNLDYIAKIAPDIDMIFIPTWGEESFVIKKLKPKYTFPMHDIGREHNYARFAERAEKEKLPTQVIAAEKQGDHFFYSNGKMKSSK